MHSEPKCLKLFSAHFRETRKLSPQQRETEPELINHFENKDDYCHQIHVSVNRKHMWRGAVCAQRVRTRTAVTCACWQERAWEKSREGRLLQQCAESRLLRQSSRWVDLGRPAWWEHRQLVARPGAAARQAAVEEAMGAGSLPVSWPGHEPAAELPKAGDGRLSQAKSCRQALGCRGCAPQSSAPPRLVQGEEMRPWPPAAACSR